MEMRTGRIFDIQRFCVHDGDGIRTTVFFKGCPLHCEWCHNPESWQSVRQIFFSGNLCIDCGRCGEVCAGGDARAILGVGGGRDDCAGCMKCAEVCPSGAIKTVGRSVSVDEVLAVVEKDRVFYENSQGGMTVSGGEPFQQSEFLYEILSGAKARGIDTVVETCGFTNWDRIERVLDFTDHFFYDIKDTDAERFRAMTGGGLDTVLKNLAGLNSSGARITLRCILIEGVNASRQHFLNIVNLWKEYGNVEKVELLPYHEYGKNKWGRLGIETGNFAGAEPSEQSMEEVVSIFCENEVPFEII